MIKKLHQTAKTSQLSPLGNKSQGLMKKYHKGWKYKLWTDNDLKEMVETVPEFTMFREYWDKLQGIQRADIGRYMFIYTEGGLYADTDVLFKKGIEELPNDGTKIWLSPSIPILPGMKNTTTNYIIYSKEPRHPFILGLLQGIDQRIRNGKKPIFEKEVPYTTGRHVITTALEKYPLEDVKMMPNVLNKYCNHTKIPNDAIAYHEGSTARVKGESWVEKSDRDFLDAECKIREAFGIDGNECQFPLYLTLIIIGGIGLFLMIAIPVGIKYSK